MKLNIIDQSTAPMQLADFINLPDPNDGEKELLYWYDIHQENEGELNLKKQKYGQRFPLIEEAVLSVRAADEAQGVLNGRGLYLEFGFTSGRTLNFIAAMADNSLVYGFDSCNGVGGGDLQKRKFAFTKTIDHENVVKGTYKQLDETNTEIVESLNAQNLTIPLKNRTHEDEPPFIPFTPLCNAVLYIGQIKDAIATFRQQEILDESNGDYISFLFIDVNDKRLTKEILNQLARDMARGRTILIVDHDLDYDVIKIKPKKVKITSTVSRYTQDDPEIGMWLKQFIQFPPENNSRGGKQHTDKFDPGNNVLHFNSRNRNEEFSDNPYIKELFDSWYGSHINFNSIKVLHSDSQILRYGLYHARSLWADELKKNEELLFLEFGFCSGRTLNYIGALLRENESLYGFDSGLGLREKWRHKFPTGTFRYNKTLKKNDKTYRFEHLDVRMDRREIDLNTIPDPDMFIPFIPHEKAKLVLGFIETTLPVFIEEYLRGENKRHVAMIFIDTDLYSAAKHILSQLDPYIMDKKTIIVFDEAFNFKGTVDKSLAEKGLSDRGKKDEWRFHEFMALTEFGNSRNGYTPLAYNANGQQLAIYLNK